MRKPYGMKYTDEDITNALRKCAEDLNDPKFGVKSYDNWRKNQKTDYPSAPLLLRRFVASGDRGWNAWKAVAGLPETKRHGKLGIQSITDDEIYLSLARMDTFLGGFPTIQEYDLMKLDSDACSASIRYRIGKWSEARYKYREWKKANSDTDWKIEIPSK